MNDPRSQDDTGHPQRPAGGPEDSGDDATAAAETPPADEAEADADGGAADEATGAAADTRPPRRGRLPGVLAVLALLVALAAAGAAGWLAWRLQALEQGLARVPEERAEALADLARASELADLEGRVAALARTQEEQAATAAKVRERVERVQESFASLRELAGRDQVGWRMAEVRYLVTVAARRLALAGDVEAAIAALEGADDALASLGDARLLPLRERIVEDLDALRAVEPADVEGLALRLRSLERRAAGLPEPAAAPADGDGDGDGAGGSWWQQVKRQLAQFVVVRREAQPAPPPASAPADALAPDEALRLALADATRAALARDAGRYRDAMDEAIGVVRERFAPDAPATTAFRERLEALRERPVRTELPDLGPTLDLAERLSTSLQRADEPARAAQPDDGEG